MGRCWREDGNEICDFECPKHVNKLLEYVLKYTHICSTILLFLVNLCAVIIAVVL